MREAFCGAVTADAAANDVTVEAAAAVRPV